MMSGLVLLLVVYSVSQNFKINMFICNISYSQRFKISQPHLQTLLCYKMSLWPYSHLCHHEYTTKMKRQH